MTFQLDESRSPSEIRQYLGRSYRWQLLFNMQPENFHLGTLAFFEIYDMNWVILNSARPNALQTFRFMFDNLSDGFALGGDYFDV